MGLFHSKWERTVDNNLFDYIEVDYFRNFKFTTIANYLIIIGGLFLHTALYAVDVYTCVRLLAFNEWSSQVKPYLSFKISKWLFAACIICSIVLLIFDTIKGVRVYLTRNISLIYTNAFAKTAKSLRYKYHCVLNEINPPQGFDRMAFYTYFTLSASKKLILADSPRQVINALTLYSVFDLESGSSFWDKLKTLSTQNRNEALILYSMFVSFVIWIFFMGELFFAIIFMFPVYHNIRKQGIRSMKQYVCIKVDQTVKSLARKFAKKRLLKENRKRTQEKLRLDEKPSIPSIPSLTQTPFVPLPRDATSDSVSSLGSSDSSNAGIDVNPFRNPPVRKAPIPAMRSQTSLLSSYTGPQLPQQLHNKTSQASLLTRYPEAPPPTLPQNPFYAASTHAGSSYSVQNSATSLVSLTDPTHPGYPARQVFLDEEKELGFTEEYSIPSDTENYRDDLGEHDAEYNPLDDADYDSLLDDDAPSSRAHVRPSLILRAQDMESEDYFKLRPQQPQSYVPDFGRGTGNSGV